jgi:hypothetical protein
MSVTYRLQFLAMGFEPTLTRATVWISDPRVRSTKIAHPQIALGKISTHIYRDEK